MLNYAARPNKNILVVLISKLSQKILENYKTIFFSNKGLNTNNIILVDNSQIVRKEEIILRIMNNYLTNITTHLKLKPTKTDPKLNL